VDVRLLIPRVRRSIDGPTAVSASAASTTLNDSQVKDLVADAIADVIFYTAGTWNHTLTVTDDDDGIPTEYAVTPDLALEEQTVVVAQAALNYFFHAFKGVKISERIVNEAREWEYKLSATALADQMKQLREARDAALEIITGGGAEFTTYISFIAVRDAATSAIIEPEVSGLIGVGGQSYDARFMV
jgi:hypothetical protein